MRFCYQKLGQGVLGFGAFFFLRTIFASTIIELLIMFIKYKNTLLLCTPIIWPPDGKSRLIGKDPDAEKDWRQEEKGMTENEMVGLHHQINGHEFEQTLGVGDGQGSGASCSPWGHRVGHDNQTTKYKTSMLYWWFHMPSPSSSWHPWGKCYDCFTDEKTEICRVKWVTASEGKMWDLPSSFWLHSLCSELLGLL